MDDRQQADKAERRLEPSARRETGEETQLKTRPRQRHKKRHANDEETQNNIGGGRTRTAQTKRRPPKPVEPR